MNRAPPGPWRARGHAAKLPSRKRLPWLNGTFSLSGGQGRSMRGDHSRAYLRRVLRRAPLIAATYKWEAKRGRQQQRRVGADSGGGDSYGRAGSKGRRRRNNRGAANGIRC